MPTCKTRRIATCFNGKCCGSKEFDVHNDPCDDDIQSIYPLHTLEDGGSEYLPYLRAQAFGIFCKNGVEKTCTQDMI